MAGQTGLWEGLIHVSHKESATIANVMVEHSAVPSTIKE